MIQKLCFGFLLVFGLTTCTTEPLISGNDLEVIVTNEDENVSPQTIVKLYLSKTYYEEGIAWDSLITDNQGTAYFVDLDPKITELYVEAIKGSARNWGYRHEIALVKGKNRMVTKIEDSNENFLAGKLGRDWIQTGYTVDGISNEECEYRRIYRFERDDILYISTSDDCRWAENFSNFSDPDVWYLNQNSITIGKPTNPQAQRIGTIQILDKNTLQFFYQKAGANGNSTYIETFQAVTPF